MKTIEIPDVKKFFYFPEHLGECDAAQYADMAKLMFMYQSGEITYEDFKTLAVYALLRLKPSKNKDDRIFENVYFLSQIVEEFFEKTEEDGTTQLKIKQYYVNNHLPKIKTGFFQTFYGPEDVFENVEFGQYVDGLEEFINFSQTGEMQYLRKLFAIFYLPKNETYHLRKSKLRGNTVFRFVDIRHLYGFYLFFSAMQLFIVSGEIVVHGNSIDLSIIYTQSEEGKSNIPGTGMFGLLTDIAEKGTFGPYDQTRRANMWDVIKQLYNIQKKNLDEKSNESTAT